MKWVDCVKRPPEIRAAMVGDSGRVFHKCRFTMRPMMADPGNWVVEDDGVTKVLSAEAFAKQYITKASDTDPHVYDTRNRKTTK